MRHTSWPVRSGSGDPPQPAIPACRAPLTSLLLDPRGFVRACAGNHTGVLGTVVTDRLGDIWAGPEVAALRAALAADDFGRGCRVCAEPLARGDRAGSLAETFDHFALPPSAAPPWPAQIEFALGNTCNLQCVMCTGELSSAIRSRREHLAPLPSPYDDRFFADLRPFLDHLERARFLGGEPFLVAAHFRVWDLLIEAGRSTPCHVTTNGTQWNDRVERVLDELPVSLAVSMDGIRPATVEAIRVGSSLRTMLQNLDRFVDYTRERGTDLSLTFALQRGNWHELGEFLRFADDRDLEVYVNTVGSPRRLSLFAMTFDEVGPVLGALEAEELVNPPLRRNAPVWRAQLELLRRYRARLTGGSQSVPVDVSSRRSAPSARSGAEPAGSAPSAGLRAWAAGGPVALLTLDERLTVVAADPPGTFLGADVDPVGWGIDELAQFLESLFGRAAAEESWRVASACRDRTMHFRDHAVRTEVRMVDGPTAAGYRWDFAARVVGPVLADDPPGGSDGD